MIRILFEWSETPNMVIWYITLVTDLPAMVNTPWYG